MKMLIIGIDGLGWEGLEAFGLHRLKSRISKGMTGNPAVENIISRGWCEIYSGADCYKTGAFFQVPQKRGGRIVSSQATGEPRVQAHIGSDAMLWHRLNALGHSVGLFTVPTITKPFELDGFVVAGTGGGSFGSGLGASSVFPDDLFRHRKAAAADLGFRYGYGAFLPANLEELELKANAHLALYFHEVRAALASRPVDVAWICTRFITELGYKFFRLVQTEPTNSQEAALKELVLSLSGLFDEMLDVFIDELASDELFIVSDHGLGAFTHRVNLNHALVELGELRVDVARTAARRIYQKWRAIRTRHPINRAFGFSYHMSSSRAFSIGYTNTVYINDARFFGPEMSTAERAEYVAKLATKLNCHCVQFPGMEEVRFEPTGLPAWTSGPNTARLPQPDIRAHFPNGLANLGTGIGVSVPNGVSFGHEMFSRGVPGEYSGIKTDDTLSGYVGKHPELVKQTKLTDLYGSILAVGKAIA